ncbi:MAG: hypothetical protein ACT4PL_14200 [Phycisphaerales bacterium]
MDAATLFDAVVSEPAALESPTTVRTEIGSRADVGGDSEPLLVAPRLIAPGDPPDLDRAGVLESILRVNRTVAREFLDQFKDDSLLRYLAHLESSERPRDRHAHWTRPGDSPSIIGRESAI